jgi:hypothetical protein
MLLILRSSARSSVLIAAVPESWPVALTPPVERLPPAPFPAPLVPDPEPPPDEFAVPSVLVPGADEVDELLPVPLRFPVRDGEAGVGLFSVPALLTPPDELIPGVPIADGAAAAPAEGEPPGAALPELALPAEPPAPPPAEPPPEEPPPDEPPELWAIALKGIAKTAATEHAMIVE